MIVCLKRRAHRSKKYSPSPQPGQPPPLEAAPVYDEVLPPAPPPPIPSREKLAEELGEMLPPPIPSREILLEELEFKENVAYGHHIQ